MKLHLSNPARKSTRYCFAAKLQVAVGEDITSASSHAPRHWMWHGNGHESILQRRSRIRRRNAG